MRVKVDPNSGVPAYKQIVDQVRFQIAAGILKPGDEVPSTRSLSLELRLNPMTVSKAWGILEEDGFLSRRAGLALTVAHHGGKAGAAQRIRELEMRLEDPASAAVQLGIPAQKAAEIFHRMIQSKSKTEEK